MKLCPNGEFVARDPDNDCAFFPCEPVGRPTAAPSDGGPILCTADAKRCPDGSFVSRDPNNNCEFFPCPTLTPSQSPTPSTCSYV